MVDCESEVFNYIAPLIRNDFPGIYITGEYIRTPPSFPHVTIVETDNYASRSRRDSSKKETFSLVTFTVDVYSNKTTGKKAECKAILNRIDELMYLLNLTRISMTPVPNMEDATIYRLTARYRAETDGEKIYRV